MSYHQIILVGRLGGDPDIRTTPKGTKLAKFSVATDVGYGEYKKTAWWRCTAWAKTADVAERFTQKGKEVLIVGEIEPGDNGGPRMYEGNDGSQRCAGYEVKVIKLQLLGSARDSGGDRQESVYEPPTEDIPF